MGIMAPARIGLLPHFVRKMPCFKAPARGAEPGASGLKSVLRDQHLFLTMGGFGSPNAFSVFLLAVIDVERGGFLSGQRARAEADELGDTTKQMILLVVIPVVYPFTDNKCKHLGYLPADAPNMRGKSFLTLPSVILYLSSWVSQSIS